MIATLIFIQKMLCLSRRSRHKMINRRNPVVRLCRNIYTRKIAYNTLRTPKGHYQTAQINQHLVNVFVSSSFIKERRETSTSSERQASWHTSTISGHFYNFRGLTRPAFEVIKPLLCSTQLNMKFILLINIKTTVAILILMSRINNWL